MLSQTETEIFIDNISQGIIVNPNFSSNDISILINTQGGTKFILTQL